MKQRPSPYDRYRRILITGAQSCGKSTLAGRLSERLMIPAMPEAARDILEQRGLTGGELFTAPSWRKESVQRAIFEEQNLRKHRGDCAILDRGEIDSYVYSLLQMHADADCEEWLNYVRTRARVARDDYDVVILCPPTIPLVEDGLRNATVHSREVIHLLFRGALEELGYRYLELRAQSPAGREQETLRYMAQQGELG